MENKEIRLKIDNETRTYPDGISFYEIAREYEKKGGDRILLVQFNNRLRELGHHAHEDGELKLLTLRDKAGYDAYRRSLCLMLLNAISDVSGCTDGYQASVHFIVSDGLYCTLKNSTFVTDEFLEKVRERMRLLISRNNRIHKKNVSTHNARQIFRERGMDDKDELFTYRLDSRTNLYEVDDYIDYYYGYMVHDTSYLTLFDLVRYQEGFVLLLPSMEDADKIQPFEPVEKLFDIQNESLSWGRRLGILDVADLNGVIVSGRATDLMMTQEAYHEKQIADIAQQIASDPRRKIVMIAGPSSSGKTTFSHRLSAQLSVYGMTPHPIPCDDYFKNRVDTPKNPDGSYDFECLEAIDVDLFNHDMAALLRGEKVDLPTYNFKTGMREYKGKSMQLGEGDILVIEGIHCLNDKLSSALPRESKFKIYISALTQINVDRHNRIATTDGRLLRRIVRDARTRGNTAADTIRMWPSVRRGEENYIFPYQESADVMFNSALIYELAVIKTYALPLLFAIREDSPEYVEAKRLLKFLDYFVPMPAEAIPQTSLIREFIGGGCFDV